MVTDSRKTFELYGLSMFLGPEYMSGCFKVESDTLGDIAAENKVNMLQHAYCVSYRGLEARVEDHVPRRRSRPALLPCPPLPRPPLNEGCQPPSRVDDEPAEPFGGGGVRVVPLDDEDPP